MVGDHREKTGKTPHSLWVIKATDKPAGFHHGIGR